MMALLIANTAVTISEFAGIASGLALFGVPKTVSVPLVALLVWMLTMSGSFRRIEKILLLVSCVFVTYIVAAFLAGPNWGEVAVATVTPHIASDPRYVSLLVATIGTTIAPWMIFLAQNNVVDKNIREDGIVLQRIDTATGSISPPQSDSRSPGSMSRCTEHRQLGQWFRWSLPAPAGTTG